MHGQCTPEPVRGCFAPAQDAQPSRRMHLRRAVLQDPLCMCTLQPCMLHAWCIVSSADPVMPQNGSLRMLSAHIRVWSRQLSGPFPLTVRLRPVRSWCIPAALVSICMHWGSSLCLLCRLGCISHPCGRFHGPVLRHMLQVCRPVGQPAYLLICCISSLAGLSYGIVGIALCCRTPACILSGSMLVPQVRCIALGFPATPYMGGNILLCILHASSLWWLSTSNGALHHC